MMRSKLKRTGFLVLLLILMVNTFAACQNQSAPRTNWVEPCDKRVYPLVTRLTVPKGSSQNLYVSSGTSLYELNTSDGALQWCQHFHSLEDWSSVGSVTLSNGMLFSYTDDNQLAAFDETTGSYRWSSHKNFLNFLGSPPVFNHLVYGGFESMYAFQMQDGTIQWHYHPWDETWITTRPTISNGLMYFATKGENPSFRQLYAIDATTGQMRWTVPLDDEGLYVVANPVVEQGVVLINQNGTVHAFDAQTGQALWQFGKEILTFDQITGANGSFYVMDKNTVSTVSALNARDGSVRWSVPLGSNQISVLANGETLYVFTYKGVTALNGSDGSERWYSQVQLGSYQTVVHLSMSQDELFIGTRDSTDTGQYILHALNTQNGSEDWSADFPEKISIAG